VCILSPYTHSYVYSVTLHTHLYVYSDILNKISDILNSKTAASAALELLRQALAVAHLEIVDKDRWMRCVLQCVAVCFSVLQCGAVWCIVVHCGAVCCSVVQCVAVWCSVLQCDAV